MRVGPHGLLRPSPRLKLLIKEVHHSGQRGQTCFGLPEAFPGAALSCVAGLASFYSEFQIAHAQLGFSSLSAAARWEFSASCWVAWPEQPLFADGRAAHRRYLVKLRTAAGMALVSALLFTGR